MNCKSQCKPVVRKLNAYLDDELPEDKKKQISEHLSGCILCRQELDALRKVNSLLAEDREEFLPLSLRKKLIKIPEYSSQRRNRIKVTRAITPLPAAAAVLLTLISALFLGRTFLTYQKEEPGYESYQFAQDSFYTLWEEIAYER